MNVICEAYKIPFFLLPTPFSKANNASARANSGFVTQAVNDLLQPDLIEESFFFRAGIINSLSVSTRSSGKLRVEAVVSFLSGV